MAEVTADVSITPNRCRDVIGVRGLCATTFPYYLDTLGISLSKTAKLADSSMVTARQLVDDAVEFSWGEVFSDLRIDGFKVNGIKNVVNPIFTDTVQGSGTYEVEVRRVCDIDEIFVGKVQMKTHTTADVHLYIEYNGTQSDLYVGVLDDETLTVTIDNHYPYDKMHIVAIVNSGEVVGSTGDGVVQMNAHTECSERLFYCKYWMHLVKAVMYKSAAFILNASLFSDRYNDLIVYKSNEIALRISQLDSSLNLLGKDGRINEKGKYQLEIENINNKLKEIVKQSYCTCCFECDNVISSRITIP